MTNLRNFAKKEMRKIFWLGVLIPVLGWAQFDRNAVLQFQRELNASFADSVKSPLTTPDRLQFHTLDFFAPDPDYCVIAQFRRTKKEKPFGMKTTTGRLPTYVKYGELHFMLKGRPFKLNVYQNVGNAKKAGYENHLFLPFSDLTSGNQTYIGGRYIDLTISTTDSVVIDFNQAYNPYCAYNYKYSCPIVPLENDLDIEILAGVKKFHD